MKDRNNHTDLAQQPFTEFRVGELRRAIHLTAATGTPLRRQKLPRKHWQPFDLAPPTETPPPIAPPAMAAPWDESPLTANQTAAPAAAPGLL
jgi:hypothetical protein